MPVATQEVGPLTFSNNFWGKEDAGYHVLMERMRQAKTTSDDIRRLYRERAEIEEGYAKRLMRLAKQPLGKDETGCLSQSLVTARVELEQVAKTHQYLADHMRTQLESPLAEFAIKQGESRKVQQGHIEKVHRNKVSQEAFVQKAKDKYEADCIKLNGYVAQQNMLTGKDLEKNNMKLEKVQASAQQNDKEYQMYVRALTETIISWNSEWKTTCDKFQILEEDRIGFMKGNLWEYTNLVSTACVKDDESCEKIRTELEKVEVTTDVEDFIKSNATGPEMQRPPKYHNFYTDSPIDGAPQYVLANFAHFKEGQSTRSSDDAHSSPKSVRSNAPTDGRRSSMASSRPQPSRMSNGQPSSRQQQNGTNSPSRPPSRMVNSQRPQSRNDGRRSPEPMYGRDQPTQLERRLSMINGHGDAAMNGNRSTSPIPSPLEQFDSQRPKTPGGNGTNFPEFKVAYPASPSSEQRAFEANSQPSFTTPTGMQHVKEESIDQEPLEPRGPTALAVGNNVFEVDTHGRNVRDERSEQRRRQESETNSKLAESDPIAAALRELKNMTSSGRSKEQSRKAVPQFDENAPPYLPPKEVTPPSSMRRSPSPQPEMRRSPSPQPNMYRGPSRNSQQRPLSRSGSRNSPPARRASVVSNGSSLAPPAPGFTAAELQQTTQQYAQQAQAVLRGSKEFLDSAEQRTVSPQPYRSSSPSPQMQRQPVYHQPPAQYQPEIRRRTSTVGSLPPQQQYPSPSPAHDSPAQYYQQPASQHMYQPQQPYHHESMPYPQRSVSPQPYQSPHHAPPRSHSSNGYYGSPTSSPSHLYTRPPQTQQWTDPRVDPRVDPRPVPAHYNVPLQRSPSRGGYQQGPPPQHQSRPASVAGGSQIMRSPSRAGPPSASSTIHGTCSDGRPILFYVKTVYDYEATIAQEISFIEGQMIAVLRTQDDGWWEGELVSTRARGVFPSNFVTAA